MKKSNKLNKTEYSIAIFKRFDIYWQLLGYKTKYNAYLMYIYQTIITIAVTIGFPLHLNIGLLLARNQEEFFNNMALNVASIACTIKIITYTMHINEMEELTELYAKLDARLQKNDESTYFQYKVKRFSHFMVTMFSTSYFSSGIVLLISLALGGKRRLLCPAWLPIDWETSSFSYICAIIYQYIGLCMQTVQNVINDAYSPVAYCTLAGHVHILAMRISKIGYNAKMADGINATELHECFEDYSRIMCIHRRLERIVSIPLLVQFLANALNICAALVYLLFFADNIIGYIYYIMFLFSIIVELFPVCYYGSLMEDELRNLPYALFTCKWFTQTNVFRRSIIVFTQISLRNVPAFAGGLFRIHLDSFFATCKMAYSFFTLVMSIK
ncbi:odorant receptor 33b-like [Teleopsis dalmanni]|uniref:odorant receptor 33b-like n=1 Tax=Teleopsis dalmanni TaxID=139649 RepID=UPI0018CCBB5D|nr:odorant receptor 33b-like [Teleopsis dalmanni]